jgi:nitroimidazol reductase NimA-like FMN-containing flavoprotein (pyridoxamine 5'-phosphate oxidase superfamily)
MIKNLDERAAGELLKQTNFGHLGVILKSGEPYVMPVNYIYPDDKIYLHSLPGAKLDARRAVRPQRADLPKRK